MVRASVSVGRKEKLFKLRNTQFNPKPRKDQASHSHPGNAFQRAEASRFMDTIATSLSQRRFDISISPRESGRGTAGNRLFRTPKDLLSEAVIGVVSQGDLITMVDTDAHLNTTTLNSYAGHDMALYTLSPEGLTGKGPESFWQFTTPDVVVEEVAGGASYEHQIWDWTKDFYVFGSHWKTYVYDVIRYNVGPSRSVIVLSLARTIYLPQVLCELMIPGLSDFVPARMRVERVRNFLVGSFGPPTDRKVHILNTNQLGARHTAVTPEDYESLRVASLVTSGDVKGKEPKLLPSDVQRYLTNSSSYKFAQAQYYTLAAYFSSSMIAVVPLNYQCKDGVELEEGVAYNTQTASGPVPPAVAPVSSGNNDARALTKRVTEVQNNTPFPEDIKGYAAEFVHLVVRDNSAGKCTPISQCEVAERQSRPSQKARRTAESLHTELDTKVLPTQGFMKKEPGASVSDPRVINTVPTDQTNRLSKYTYAAKGHFKTRCSRWYCPGKTPGTLAQSVRGAFNASVKRGQGPLVGGDYSRMDGRISVFHRTEVYEPIMLRLFSDDCTDELRTLLVRERKAKVSMRSGAKTRTVGGNISGSPCTTDLNTTNAAFIEYAARRRAGEEPAAAYDNLGLYFGDDSLFSDSMQAQVLGVATEVGMVMTIEDEPVGSPAGRCVFLSRVYPDISTSLHSYPCMVRALSKLVTATVHKGSKHHDLGIYRKLKGQASAMIDGHVPVLGPFARLLEQSGGSVSDSDAQRVLNNDRELRYKLLSTAAKTKLSPMEQDLFVSSIGRDLDIPPEEVSRLDSAMSAASKLSEVADLKLASLDRELPSWAVWVDSSSLPINK